MQINQVASSSTSTQPLSVTHCLSINEDLTWNLYIHGKQVNVAACTELQPVPDKLLPPSVDSLLRKLDTLNVCVGNHDAHFIELCASHKGQILSPDGTVAAFNDMHCAIVHEGESVPSTVRTSKCDLIVSRGARCDHCKKYRSVLRAMYSRQQKSTPSSERTDISSHTNYRYLTTPEKAKRMTNLRAEVVQQKRKISLLEERVKYLTEVAGIEVDDDINHDLSDIMDEMTEEVHKKFPENSFERVFWNQQLQAKSLKDAHQIRWHPAMIKWCLNLKLLSSSSYHALRSSGVLVLPSERTLRDYTHWMRSDSGFNK